MPADASPTFSTSRAATVVVCLVILFAALLGRVGYLETYGRQKTIGRADRQQMETITLAARRGSIYDTNGMDMAGTVQTQSLFIDPKFMLDSYQENGRSLVDMDAAINKLAILIDKDPFDLSQMLGDRSTSRFVKVADNLDDDAVAAINKLDLPGVGVSTSSARYYPMGSLAAHILGGVGAGGDGLDGLELRFNKLLSGHPGYERVTKDASRHSIGAAAEDYLPPEHGQHLVLTIDSNIQLMAEQELAASCEKFHAAHGEVVVMDPRTGNVLALANYPTFNPQNLDDSTPDARCNSAIVRPYEPGSTFKPFFVGPALMWHVTKPGEVWPIPGISWRTPYGRRITDVHQYGPLTTWDGLVKSSNIVMSMLSERMGNPRMFGAITKFGFGRDTGIELPGENPGKVKAESLWSKYDTESVAQGYAVMVTPLQLCRGFCAYANGGRLPQVRIIKGVLDADGNTIARNPAPPFDDLPQVIDPTTVAVMRRILADVVIRGTAKGNRSEIWNIVGKTGTAHISIGKGGYSQTRFNSSFIACAPAEDPKLVIAYIIHDPDREIAHYGGFVAAPGACRLMERALSYMNVPASPDLPEPPDRIQKLLWEFDPNQVTDRSYGAPKLETADAGN